LLRQTEGQAIRLLDVGSGAGLPGVIIAIACPQVQVNCVDAVAKKAAFVQQAAIALNLPNLLSLHARVQTLAAAAYDVVASRAFAALDDFTSLTAAQLKQGTGVWLAMKGKIPDAEIAALPPGLAVFHVEPLVIPGLSAQRCLVWMRPKPVAADLQPALT
jgi:16S rRNA (guanine527-N7)-methyltransferase